MTQFVPWSRAVAAAYRRGTLPAWFPANGCGAPLWANPQAQAVTPTTSSLSADRPGPPPPEPRSSSSRGPRARSVLRTAAGARPRGLALGGDLLRLRAPRDHVDALPRHVARRDAAVYPLGARSHGARRGRRIPGTCDLGSLLLLGGYPETEFSRPSSARRSFAAVARSQRVAPRRAWAARPRRRGLAARAGIDRRLHAARGAGAARSERSGTWVARSRRPAAAPRTAGPRSPADVLGVSRFWLVPEAQGNPRDQDKFGPYSFAGRTSGYAGILVVAFALASSSGAPAPRSSSGRGSGACSGSRCTALVSAARVSPARCTGSAGHRRAPDDQPRQLHRRALAGVARRLGMGLARARRTPVADAPRDPRRARRDRSGAGGVRPDDPAASADRRAWP